MRQQSANYQLLASILHPICSAPVLPRLSKSCRLAVSRISRCTHRHAHPLAHTRTLALACQANAAYEQYYITYTQRWLGNFLGGTRAFVQTLKTFAPHTLTHIHMTSTATSAAALTSLFACVCVCVCLTCLLVQYSSDCKRSSYSHLFPPSFPSSSSSLCLLLHLRLLLILLLPYNFFSCHTNEQRAYLVCTLAACACVCLQEFSFPSTPPSLSLCSNLCCLCYQDSH